MSDHGSFSRAPTRDEVIAKLEKLISGHLSRDEVAGWASQWVSAREPGVDDPAVWNALKALSAADMISLNRPYLYNEIDFKVWLKEILTAK
jgi:hypothetical protein